ncbi:MAG: ATP-binding protein [Acidobacteriota bacterium]
MIKPQQLLSRLRPSGRRRKLLCKGEIQSQLQAIHRITGDILQEAETVGFKEEAVKDLRVALDEALANAVIHGNSNVPDRRVKVRCYLHGDDLLEIRIRDQGTGFRTSFVPDPTVPENLLRTHGRGIFLISHYMDRIEFNRRGNEIRMWKRKKK